MLYFSSLWALRTVALALVFFVTSAVAQTPHNHGAMVDAKPAVAVVAAPPATDGLGYQSVFVRYQAYRDEKLGSWREANDTVERIGGWRAYAKEAQQPATTAPAKPDPTASQGKKP